MEFFGKLKGKYLIDVVHDLTDIVRDYWWLFVCIDSSRGEHLNRNKSHFKSTLDKAGINCRFNKSGFWIAGGEIFRMATTTGIITNFSAAYLVQTITDWETEVNYSETSESVDFTNGPDDECKRDLAKISASAYLADGTGLNYFCTEKRLGVALNSFNHDK